MAYTISKRALIQRINRRLKDDGQVLRTARGEGAQIEVGRYYSIDIYHNCLVFKHINLEPYARKLGVLSPWERLASPEARVA